MKAKSRATEELGPNMVELAQELQGNVFQALSGISGRANKQTGWRSLSWSDHQCFKDVLVVKGKGPNAKTGDYDLLEQIQIARRDDFAYPVDTFPGELGACKPV